MHLGKLTSGTRLRITIVLIFVCRCNIMESIFSLNWGSMLFSDLPRYLTLSSLTLIGMLSIQRCSLAWKLHPIQIQPEQFHGHQFCSFRSCSKFLSFPSRFNIYIYSKALCLGPLPKSSFINQRLNWNLESSPIRLQLPN